MAPPPRSPSETVVPDSPDIAVHPFLETALWPPPCLPVSLLYFAFLGKSLFHCQERLAVADEADLLAEDFDIHRSFPPQ